MAHELPLDPRHRLSETAQLRISKAYIQAQAASWEGQANIDAKHLEGDADAADFEQNQANLRAARIVLAVLFEEYQSAGLALHERRTAMQEEVEAAAYSLELHQSQQRLLELEYFYPMEEVNPRSGAREAGRKPRGRRPTTPYPKMLRASEMKTTEGRPNRQIAKFLYNTESPTKSQISGVPTRLRSFRKTMMKMRRIVRPPQ